MSETTPDTPRPVRDFSRPRPRILFTIDGDTFEAAPAIPAETLVRFTNQFADLAPAGSGSSGDQFGAITSVLRFVLLPESLERLSSRLSDLANPVDMDQLGDIVMWLLEQYGLRPTQPSSNSSAGPGSPVSGTSLTGSTPDAVSTSAPLPLTVS